MVIMSSLPPPTEGILHLQSETQAFVHDRCLGNGTLYIAQARLSWCNEQGQGFSLEYPSISVHAICRDTTKFPHECIYCMLEAPVDDSNEDDEDRVGEVRFVPADKDALERMFASISDGQVLHPDPEEEEKEEMAGFSGEYFTHVNDAEFTEEGQATLERLEGVFQMPSQQEFVEMTSATHTNGQATNGDMPDEEMKEGNGQFEDA